MVRARLSHCVYLFFFQAEDGIRDADVTGVQTCALPICWPRLSSRGQPGLRELERGQHEDVGALVVLAVAATNLGQCRFERADVAHRRTSPGAGGVGGPDGGLTTRIPPERRSVRSSSGGTSSSANANTSSIVSTSLMSSNFRTSSGKSIKSFLLRSGTSTEVTPARAAAVSFSLRPPIGST